MPVFDQDQLKAIQEAVAAALAQQQQQGPPAVPQADLAAAAAAAVAAAAPQVAAVDINAISHTIPSFWPEDVDGFFSTVSSIYAMRTSTAILTPWSQRRHLPPRLRNSNSSQKAVSGGAHCNPSYWGPSLSGYSGSV